MNYAILAAGGKGVRFGRPKQFCPLRGKAMFLWALEAFQAEKTIDRIVFVYPMDESESEYRKLGGNVRFVRGGETRYESVRNGFESIEQPEPDDLVLIHDVARPLVSSDLLRRVLDATMEYGAVVPAWLIQETVKEVENSQIARTVPRENLWLAQTPQGFRYRVLKAAYELVEVEQASPETFTDESALVESTGFPVNLILGERRNIKVTEPEDLALAEFFLDRREF